MLRSALAQTVMQRAVAGTSPISALTCNAAVNKVGDRLGSKRLRGTSKTKSNAF